MKIYVNLIYTAATTDTQEKKLNFIRARIIFFVAKLIAADLSNRPVANIIF